MTVRDLLVRIREGMDWEELPVHLLEEAIQAGLARFHFMWGFTITDEGRQMLAEG